MAYERPHLNIELFPVNLKQLSDACSEVETYVCKPYFSEKADSLFFSDREKLWHLASLLELEGTPALVREYGGESTLVALSQPKSDNYYAFEIESGDTSIYLDVCDHSKLRDVLQSGFTVVRSLLARAIRAKVASPLKCEGYSVYDTSTDLTTELSAQNRSVGLLKPLQVHTGFGFQFRTFGNRAYVQILPRSRISYRRSVWDLLSEGWSREEIVQQFPYVRVEGYGSQKILEISQKTVADPLDEEPFLGRTFVEFSQRMFPSSSISHNKISLVMGASSRSPRINYFPSSWAFPSLTFSGISFIDYAYYSELTGVLKTQSRHRMAQAQEWVRRLSPISIMGQNVEVNPIPLSIHYDPATLEVSRFASLTSFDVGHILEPPSVTMMRYGIPTEIVAGVENYQATVNDLFSHDELKPLDVPQKIRAVVFIHSSLSAGWNALRRAIVEPGSGYRGFYSTFGVELETQEQLVSDFFAQSFVDMVASIPEEGYDCAIIVIPRYLQTQEETRRIYTDVKTMIMARGIPVQVITDNPRVTFGRDNTLLGKSKQPRTLFGISINVLGKVGTILTAIADSVANNLIPNSMTIGYNVARIVPTNLKGERTIPLTAPLVIFDNRGAYISHQDVYRLRNEVSLFDQYGDEIFKRIPSDVTTVIVHKDGFFTDSELACLEQVSKRHGMESIPISFRSNNVPRVANPRYLSSDLGLRAGTVLPLSDNDFLMMTTPISRWDPEKLGWPNPVLITLHHPYDLLKKVRLLYHIFALTKMQTGSQRPVRLPVSIHFSNMIARFLRRVGDPTPNYLKYFVHARTGERYLPRWFL